MLFAAIALQGPFVPTVLKLNVAQGNIQQKVLRPAQHARHWAHTATAALRRANNAPQ